MSSLPGFGLESKKIENYLVPDYYSSFKCKGGQCRNTCCQGWKVTISMKEYYTLHGVNSNNKMRDQIDSTFQLIEEDRSNERFARIVLNEHNQCPMLSSDGLCSIHKQFGIKVLPSVCRYYPRGQRIDLGFECSTANSCEKTLELLFTSSEPMTIEIKELSFDFKVFHTRKLKLTPNEYLDIRKNVFLILGDRNHIMKERCRQILSYLSTKEAFPILLDETDKTQLDVMNRFYQTMSKLHLLPQKIEESYLNFKADEYQNRKSSFMSLFPSWDIYLEKLMINYLYFRLYPIQEDVSNLYEGFLVMMFTIFYVQTTCVLMVKEITSLDQLVDLLVILFRRLSHTKAEKNFLILFKEFKINPYQLLRDYL